MRHKLLPQKRLIAYSYSLLRSFATPSLIYLIIAGNTLLFAGTLLFYYFERGQNPQVSSILDALWWAFSTVTTVGYGDVVPVTFPGRFVAIILMLSGAVFFFGFTAILISVYSSLTQEEVRETEIVTISEFQQILSQLDSLHKKMAVLESKITEKS